MSSMERLLAEALTLSVEERARLARELLTSLDEAVEELCADESVAQEWAAEIEDRVRAARAGDVPLLDGPKVPDELLG